MKFSPRTAVPVAALLCAFTATATAQVQQVIRGVAAPEKAEKRQETPVRWADSDFLSRSPSPSGKKSDGSGRAAASLFRSLASPNDTSVSATSIAAPVNVAGLSASAAVTGPDFSLPSAPTATAMEAHVSGAGNAVPEPASVFLIGASLAGTLLLRLRLKFV